MKHDLGEQAAKVAGGALNGYSQEKTDSARHWGIARTGQGDGSRTGSRGRARAVNYFNRRDAAEQTCATIRQSGGHARAFPADVRDESEVARLVQEVNEAFGAVDILVVNATGSQPFFSIEEQTWHCARRWSKAP